ncbi:aquaporin-9-like [Pomacea canaliculata]|uniref:aquaporin-9-like n=1 Tax=Pomacea canaliculata TaxID=400727 RepID=UPI000D7311F4|nr:aquaporin-9-like [Pomacea canaliculata]XP_025077788.1 aquaporin-9-like [Pomacea canaliculata]XP_025077789.1 aquaporin-9-like [Pomacea canaliculata]XP_025077790.1 aquaporin-9-like [Pomacea canaliculata]XP_025077791.1 aquaporin-9-like [Pomacea canaliculata]
MCLQGAVQWPLFPFYTLANLAGAFAAAAVQYGVYYDALNSYDGGQRRTYGEKATASIFSTFPNSKISTLNCFFDQVFGTFILCGCILAMTDKRNMMPHKGLLPLAVGAIVFGIGTCWAYNCGYALNPARDLGPRIFTAIAGWGVEPFSFRNYNWFWVPIVGPMVGSFVSWLVYSFFVQLHWPASKEEIIATTNSVTVTVDGKVEVAANRTGALYREHSLTESTRRLSI